MPPWPFLGIEALTSGALAERALRRDYIAVDPRVWIPRNPEDGAFTARHRAIATWLWSPRCGVLAGLSAAAPHGEARCVAASRARARQPQRPTLIDCGLSALETQIVVLDQYGDFIARVDMGYR